MQHNEKEEYLKFMILIKLRYNIEVCKVRLGFDKELIEKNTDSYDNRSYNRRYNDTHDFYNENVKILNELFNINVTGNLNDINNEIFRKWPIILEYLKSNKCDYECIIKDFENAKYYEIYTYIIFFIIIKFYNFEIHLN